MAYRRTEGGLLVPEGAHEQAVRDALRRLDDDLRLVPVDSDYFGRRVYKVVRYMGDARSVQPVLFWGDEQGNPYPLSMSILDAVQQLDRSTRGSAFDPDEHNRKLRAERKRDADADFDAIAEEFDKRLSGRFSSPLPRGRGLYAARNRVRARLKTREIKP